MTRYEKMELKARLKAHYNGTINLEPQLEETFSKFDDLTRFVIENKIKNDKSDKWIIHNSSEELSISSLHKIITKFLIELRYILK